jgi:hypothetical protein
VKPAAKITTVTMSKTTTVVSQVISPTSSNDLKRSNDSEPVDEYDFAAHSKRARVQKVVLQRSKLFFWVLN